MSLLVLGGLTAGGGVADISRNVRQLREGCRRV